jgi:hypothetical protein
MDVSQDVVVGTNIVKVSVAKRRTSGPREGVRRVSRMMPFIIWQLVPNILSILR